LRTEQRDELRAESEEIYLTLCGDEAFDAMVARDRLDEIDNGQIALVTGDALQAELDSMLS
jgi:hypothetical protein